MIIWIDAQISPIIALWITERFSCKAVALRDLGLRDATDKKIFFSAREVKAVIMSKDFDFVSLVERFGSPPQIIWLRCGNTANEQLKQSLLKSMPRVIDFLKSGETVVEIRDP